MLAIILLYCSYKDLIRKHLYFMLQKKLAFMAKVQIK